MDNYGMQINGNTADMGLDAYGQFIQIVNAFVPPVLVDKFSRIATILSHYKNISDGLKGKDVFLIQDPDFLRDEKYSLEAAQQLELELLTQYNVLNAKSISSLPEEFWAELHRISSIGLDNHKKINTYSEIIDTKEREYAELSNEIGLKKELLVATIAALRNNFESLYEVGYDKYEFNSSDRAASLRALYSIKGLSPQQRSYLGPFLKTYIETRIESFRTVFEVATEVLEGFDRKDLVFLDSNEDEISYNYELSSKLLATLLPRFINEKVHRITDAEMFSDKYLVGKLGLDQETFNLLVDFFDDKDVDIDMINKLLNSTASYDQELHTILQDLKNAQMVRNTKKSTSIIL